MFSKFRKVAPRPEDRRRGERHASHFVATLRTMAGSPVEAHVQDVSSSGFLATTPVAFMPGTMLRIGLSAGKLQTARVVRCDNNVIACEFTGAIEAGELERLIGKSGAADGE